MYKLEKQCDLQLKMKTFQLTCIARVFNSVLYVLRLSSYRGKKLFSLKCGVVFYSQEDQFRCNVDVVFLIGPPKSTIVPKGAIPFIP